MLNKIKLNKAKWHAQCALNYVEELYKRLYVTDEPDSDDIPVKREKTFLDDTEDFDFNNSDTEEIVSVLDTNPSDTEDTAETPAPPDPAPDTEETPAPPVPAPDTEETPAPPVPAPAPSDPAPTPSDPAPTPGPITPRIVLHLPAPAPAPSARPSTLIGPYQRIEFLMSQVDELREENDKLMRCAQAQGRKLTEIRCLRQARRAVREFYKNINTDAHNLFRVQAEEALDDYFAFEKVDWRNRWKDTIDEEAKLRLIFRYLDKKC